MYHISLKQVVVELASIYHASIFRQNFPKDKIIGVWETFKCSFIFDDICMQKFCNKIQWNIKLLMEISINIKCTSWCVWMVIYRCEMIHIWSMLTQVFWLYTLIINKLAERGGGVRVHVYVHARALSRVNHKIQFWYEFCL